MDSKNLVRCNIGVWLLASLFFILKNNKNDVSYLSHLSSILSTYI